MALGAHRSCSSALGVMALVCMSGQLAASEVNAPPQPILGTPEQDESEQLVIELLQHPDVKAIQASLREQLRATEIGRTQYGAATADRAVDCPIGRTDFRFGELRTVG